MLNSALLGHAASAVRRGTLIFSAAGALLACAMNVGWAAEPEANASSGVLGEIVVTARKRAESLQDVPVSITAFTAASLETIGAKGFEDVMFRTPNLYEAYLGEAKGSPPIIRGVQGTNTAGADPAVGYVVDDVYYGNNTAAVFDYFDLDSLEVLRGPQGTLFGRNTTGGVVNVRTSDPRDEAGGQMSVSYGNYNAIRAEGLITGPIAKGKVDYKLAAVYNDRDGFIENTNPSGKDLRTEHNYSIRGGLKFIVSDATEIDLRADYRDLDQRGGGTKGDGDNPIFSGIIPPLEYHFNDPWDRSVNWDQAGSETLEAWGASVTVAHQFAGSEFRSITGYRQHDYYSIFDSDFSPNHFINDGSPETFEQWSQEFRLTSKPDTRFPWIAGLYYYHGNSLDLNFITFQQDFLVFLGGVPPGAIPDQTVQAHGRQIADSYAAYAHMDFPMGERAALALGLRVTHDKKSIDYFQEDALGILGGNFTVEDSDSWTKPTGDVTFTYKFTPQSMSYATVARGYKAGGFNDGIGQADNPPFDPEYVTNYEVGWKSTWADNRVRFNIAAFYLDWTDIQVAGFDASDPNNIRRITGNFGKANSKGAEFELTAQPTNALELSLNGGFMRGGFSKDEEAGISGTDSLTGPEYSVGASAQFRQNVGANGLLTWYVDAQRQGPNDMVKGAPEAGQIIGPHQDPFNVVNARIAYEANKNWSVALWGKNLTDEHWRSKYFQLGVPFLPPGALTLSEPRTYGVEVQANF